MRVLVQRVTSARVTVAGEVVGEITPASQGLLALVGITHDDDAATATKLATARWDPVTSWMMPSMSTVTR